MPTAEKRKAILPAPKPPSSDDSDAESDDEQVAKQQKQRDDDAAKAETALSTFHGQEAEWVYVAADPEDGPFYVGRCNDMQRRGGEHDRTYIKKMREYLKLKNYTFKQIMKPVPALPNGCHPDDASDMERFWIFRFNTVFHPKNHPFGCNSKIGDHGTALSTKRYEQLERMFAEDGPGYSFPARTHQEEELACMYAKIAQNLVEKAKEVGDDEAVEIFNDCTTVMLNELHEHECRRMGLRAYVEHVLSDYEEDVDAVDKEALSAQFNLITETARTDPKFEDLAQVPVALRLATKQKVDPDGNPLQVVDTPSEAVRYFLNGLLVMIASREEAHLVWTNETNKTNMLKVRAWSRVNGKKKPARKKGTKGSEEFRLSKALVKWKATGCADLANCDVVMRSMPWWRAFSRRKEHLAELLEECVRQVRAGCGLSAEPPFPDKKVISCGAANAQVYKILNHLVIGYGTKENKERLFAVLEEQGRLDWYKEKHDAALAARKGQGAEENGSEEEGEEEE